MNYTVKGEHNRHFELFDANNNSLGKLDYTSWFSIRSAIVMQSGKTYEIAPANVFQTSIQLNEGDTKLGSLKFNWKGQIIISMENGKTYTFKRVGFFHSHFGLFTEHDQEIVILNQHFKLSEFSFNYTIETDDNYTEGKDVQILLLMVYCANYMHSMAAAAV